MPPAPLRPSRFPLRVFAIALVACAIWPPLCTLLGWRAELAESNLQANLLRIARLRSEPEPDAAIVGSSVGGRLLPVYFEGRRVLNLGLDGSRPLFGFEILRAVERPPKLVLLETSALFQPLGSNDLVLAEAMRSPGAALSRWVPAMKPEMRPVSIVYDKLKALRERLTPGRARPPLEPVQPPVAEPAVFEDVRRGVEELRARGVEVWILEVPRGAGWASGLSGPSAELASELGLGVLEPGPAIYAAEGDVLRFSDGLHLDAPSARKIAQWLVQRPPLAPRGGQ